MVGVTGLLNHRMSRANHRGRGEAVVLYCMYVSLLVYVSDPGRGQREISCDCYDFRPCRFPRTAPAFGKRGLIGLKLIFYEACSRLGNMFG